MPLSDFPVAITVARERYVVICRDVPTAQFFYGFPNALPMTACYQGAPQEDQRAMLTSLHAWMLSLLPRVVVTPTLTEEIVYRLDDAAFDAVVGYLHAVGWVSQEDLERQASTGGSFGAAARRYQESIGALSDEVLPLPTRPAERYIVHRAQTQEIAPNVRLAIREVAKRAHVRPSELWRSAISDFLLDFRLLITDEKAESNNVLTGDDALIGFAA